ncbi:MAG: acetyltransferase [Thermaurantimonas sp.]
MKKHVLIIGAGGHAAEVRDYIRFYNKSQSEEQIEVVGFIDDDENIHSRYEYSEPYLGKISDHNILPDVYYLMGIANVAFRRPIVEKFKAMGAKFTGLIHPTALISPSAKIGEGVLISHNASVGPMVRIGDFNILNSRCTIGHDTVIGNYNFISPQVALSGHTTVGNENMFGVNSATIPSIVVGNNNKIGAGTILYKNVGDNQTVFNRFNERIIKISES